MQLRVFLAVAERLHFRSAAEDLGMSQPSLSQALATLEDGLGLHLVERSTRSVLVTPAGHRLLPYARAAVTAMDAVADAAPMLAADRPEDFMTRVALLTEGIR